SVGDDISRTGNSRLFVVFDGDFLSAGGAVAVNVGNGPGDDGVALGELRGSIVRRGGNSAVVSSDGRAEVDASFAGETLTPIGGNIRQLTRAGDRRCLIVSDSYCEGALAGVAAGIRCGAGEGGGADREAKTTGRDAH